MSWRCEKCWGVHLPEQRKRVIDGIDGEEIDVTRLGDDFRPIDGTRIVTVDAEPCPED